MNFLFLKVFSFSAFGSLWTNQDQKQSGFRSPPLRSRAPAPTVGPVLPVNPPPSALWLLREACDHAGDLMESALMHAGAELPQAGGQEGGGRASSQPRIAMQRQPTFFWLFPLSRVEEVFDAVCFCVAFPNVWPQRRNRPQLLHFPPLLRGITK